MKISNNPVKYEELIKRLLRSILDTSINICVIAIVPYGYVNLTFNIASWNFQNFCLAAQPSFSTYQ